MHSLWTSDLQGDKDTVAQSLAEGEGKGMCVLAAWWFVPLDCALVKYTLVLPRVSDSHRPCGLPDVDVQSQSTLRG